MIKTHSFHAFTQGPRLLVLGAVHGNEICGPAAIETVMARLNSGEIALREGSVTFVPVCNPEAYRQDKRFIEHNLNRSFGPHDDAQLYEEKIMNALAPLLEESDVLLDIHSYTAGGPPFAFRGPDKYRKKEEAFAAALGAGYLLYGWDQAYAASGVKRPADESRGTAEYARDFGATAITLECGQHRDPQSVPVAVRGIMGALSYCGMIAEAFPPVAMKHSRVKKVIFKERPGAFVRPLKHLETVEKGAELARYDDGEVISAPFAARLIMPKADTPLGQEWLYLAVDEK